MIKYNSLKDAMKAHLTLLQNSLKSFSIYDLTSGLRVAAQSGVLELVGRAKENVTKSGPPNFTYKIEHSEVRGCVEELLDDGTFPNLTSAHNGQYRVFSFSKPISVIGTNAPSKIVSVKQVVPTVDIPKIVPKLDALFDESRKEISKVKRVGIQYKDALFVSSNGKCAWARKSDASAAFGKRFFGDSYVFKKRLEVLGVDRGTMSARSFRKKVMKFLQAKGDFEFVSFDEND